ncbi:hypothetical protein CGLAMM_04600 [Acetobacteraceae bacterium EV16G]|uniref:DUF1491 family protein n=1 Tax=Sorlinia euscelidii TaxID=3081148 RepID=UPI002F3A935C
MRLKTEFWIRALIRQQAQRGNIATIVKKGDIDAGTPYIILIDRNRNIAVFRERALADGWERLPMESQGDLDSFLIRQEKYDPDLWILELETSVVSDPIEKELTTRHGSSD